MKRFLMTKKVQFMAALTMAIVVWVMVVGLGLNTGIAGAAPVASRSNTGIAGTAALNHGCDQDQMAPRWDPSHKCFNINKVPLTRTNRNCDGSLAGPPLSTTFGFSIIIKTRLEHLIAVVVLRNATPNATYNVRLIQTPPSMYVDCQAVNGTLTTDAKGNGTTFVREDVQPGSSDAFVVLNNAANFSGDFFTTREVFFLAKR